MEFMATTTSLAPTREWGCGLLLNGTANSSFDCIKAEFLGVETDTYVGAFVTTLLLAAIFVVPLFTCAVAWLRPSKPAGLALALSAAFLLHTMRYMGEEPFPWYFHVAVTVLYVVSILAALVLSLQLCMNAAGCGTEDEPPIRVVPSKFDGEAYNREYVGCNECEKVLDTSHFYACRTCKEGKKCELSYELCGKCVLAHDQSHVVLQYKNGRAFGKVELRPGQDAPAGSGAADPAAGPLLPKK
mmetsp:Transcript_643/g.1820  ORF Transcript_643/g.1820 Transcript_643/m.1820 type:complete len:243 (-) Transcript_643:48-776(-)